MELTQRLESTQELHYDNIDKAFPEQIGFLGICGKKYPVKKGPNKIGRDRDTCNIVLDLNSISRHHAVINILNKNEFLLMDLDSANKTKVNTKTLQPYMPIPLKNGDMIQFGQVFGLFRIFEEENDLPMTQAIDVPETPIQNRCVSKLNVHATTVPESPDVSDRDDSFIVSSQQKPKNVFKSPNDSFIKTSGKPLATNKKDNVSNTPKKTESYVRSNLSNNMDNTTTTEDIHEQETQLPYNDNNISNVSMYDALTQPNGVRPLEIHEMETQLPVYLPEVCKINGQHDVQLDFSTENRKIKNISSTENQSDIPELNYKSNCKSTSLNSEKSHDIILFAEIDSSPLENNLESQSLVIPNNILHDDEPLETLENNEQKEIPKTTKKYKKTNGGRSPGDSTDCEHDLYLDPTQKILELPKGDDVTDCEDEAEPHTNINCKKTYDDDSTDFEDDLDDVKQNSKVNFEDMCTQILEEVPLDDVNSNCNNDDNLKKSAELGHRPTAVTDKVKTDARDVMDLQTQQLSEVNPQSSINLKEADTRQLYSQEIISFKKPSTSPFIKKNKDSPDMLKNISKIVKSDESNNTSWQLSINKENEQIYYAETQQILLDLNTQPPEAYKEPVNMKSKRLSLKSPTERKKPSQVTQDSDEGIDLEESINSFMSNLTNTQVRDGIKVEKSVTASVCKSREVSDSTSKKTENKSKDKLKNKDKSVNKPKRTKQSEGSSSTITKKEDKNSSDIRVFLNKHSKSEPMTSRSSTRIRKPTARLQNDDKDAHTLCDKLFKSSNMNGNAKANIEVVNKRSAEAKEKYKQKNETDGKKENNTRGEKKEARDKKSEEKPRRSGRTKEKTEPVNNVPNETVVKKTDGEHSTRSSRSRSKKSNEDHKRSSSTDHSIEKIKKHGALSDRKEEEVLEKQLRRSRRHKTSKKSEELLQITDKGGEKLPHPHEQSIVYNVSSESGLDSPNKLKRSGTFEYPSAKKTKLVVTSARKTRERNLKTHCVLFTAFPCEEVRIKLEKLGAKIVTDVSKCTVVLTMQIRRTFKLLCAMGLGKPIVGPSWVQACADTDIIVDPWLHLIKDEVTEKRFQFNLKRSLTGKRNFLSGYNISSTPSVLPSADEMKIIVQCSGGNWKAEGPLWICISSVSDKALWPTLKKKGAIIVSTEFILGGVLRQKLEIDKNRLI